VEITAGGGEHAQGINPCVARIMVLILELLQEIDTLWNGDTGSSLAQARPRQHNIGGGVTEPGVLSLTHACTHTHAHARARTQACRHAHTQAKNTYCEENCGESQQKGLMLCI